MLCVTLAHGSHQRMISEHQQLAEQKIPLVEIRIDLLRKEPDVGRFLTARPGPVIITNRRPKEGGFWAGDEEHRLRILRSAIVGGADYVDLEMDVASAIPRFGKTKRIISYHNMQETPADLPALHAEMMKLDPDIVKIAAMPKNIQDVFRMIDLLKKVNTPDAKVPTIGISMGEMGMVTRILAGKFGAPHTYCCFSKERRVAPGMIDYQTLRDSYHYDLIKPDTEIYAVIGNPIGHSLSPLIHNASFFECKLNKAYVPLLILPEDLDYFMAHASEWDMKGLSVTIPHKVNVIKSLTRQEPAVEEINACNTVLFQDGQVLGDNTDYLAAVLSIEKAMGAEPGKPSPVKGLKAMVLGSGGAGKAVAYGLKSKGAEVILTDGNNELAESVAEEIGCVCCPWTEREEQKVQIIANCTPVGMFPKVEQTPIDRSALHGNMYILDAVYNPMTTYFIRQAEERGCKVIRGVEMFIGQASLQFEKFAGQKADDEFMKNLVTDALNAAKGC